VFSVSNCVNNSLLPVETLDQVVSYVFHIAKITIKVEIPF